MHYLLKTVFQNVNMNGSVKLLLNTNLFIYASLHLDGKKVVIKK